MRNVTFKFMVTEELQTENGRQVIAIISDDNARQIVHASGLNAEVRKIAEHSKRMMALAVGRILGSCDKRHSDVAILAEAQAMGIDTRPTVSEGIAQLEADMATARARGYPAVLEQLGRSLEVRLDTPAHAAQPIAPSPGPHPYERDSEDTGDCAECGLSVADPVHDQAVHPVGDDAATVLISMISILELNRTIAPEIAADGRKAIADMRQERDAFAKKLLEQAGKALMNAEKYEALTNEVIALRTRAAELEAKRDRSDKHFEETTDRLMVAAGVDLGEFKSDGEYGVEDKENIIRAQGEELRRHLAGERDCSEQRRHERDKALADLAAAETTLNQEIQARAREQGAILSLNAELKAARTSDHAMAAVQAELARAVSKFPTWPTDPLHAMAVLGEEYGELNKAILQEVYEPHKQDRTAVRTEAVQCAAMALRFLTSIDAYRFDRCEQHRQEASK